MVEDAVGAPDQVGDGVSPDHFHGLVVHGDPAPSVHDHVGFLHEIVPVVAHGRPGRQQDVAEILEIGLEIPASPDLAVHDLAPAPVVSPGYEQGTVEPAHGQAVGGLQHDVTARVAEILVLRFADRIYAVEVEEPGVPVRVVVDAVGLARPQGHRGAAVDLGRAAVVGELHGVVDGDEDLFRVGVAVFADAAARREDHGMDESPGSIERRPVEPRIEITRRGAAVTDAEVHFLAPGMGDQHAVCSGLPVIASDGTRFDTWRITCRSGRARHLPRRRPHPGCESV